MSPTPLNNPHIKVESGPISHIKMTNIFICIFFKSGSEFFLIAFYTCVCRSKRVSYIQSSIYWKADQKFLGTSILTPVITDQLFQDLQWGKIRFLNPNPPPNGQGVWAVKSTSRHQWTSGFQDLQWGKIRFLNPNPPPNGKGVWTVKSTSRHQWTSGFWRH